MDNPNINSPTPRRPAQPAPPRDDADKPIPLPPDDLAKPIPLESGPAPKTGISHAPLNLGGGPAAKPAPKVQLPRPAAKPAPKVQLPRPAAKAPAARLASTDRITGVKTFFTKLHPGAIQFLDEQINNWLKQNPGVVVKRTNITTGEIQAKKTEPNIIITIWY